MFLRILSISAVTVLILLLAVVFVDHFTSLDPCMGKWKQDQASVKDKSLAPLWFCHEAAVSK